MTDVKEEQNTPFTAPSPAAETEPSKGLGAALEKGQVQPPDLQKSQDDCEPGISLARKSAGEKWFNRIVYTGINYWLNLSISLIVTDFFTHHRTGSGWLKRGSNKLAKGMAATGLMQEESALHSSTAGLKTLALNSGGWLLLIPMKWMEDRKRPIVHWLNERMGVNQTAPDGHKQTPDEIYIEQEQPKQGWLRVFLRRLLASSTTIVTGIWLDKAGATIDPTKSGNAARISGQDRVTGLVTDVANNTAKLARVPDKWFAENKTAQRYLGYASLDVFYTWITSTIMYLTNGARKEKMPNEIGEENMPAHKGTRTAPVEQPYMPPVEPQRTFADDTIQRRARDITPASSHAEAVTKQADHTLFLAP